MSKLLSWSWVDILAAYKAYGQLMTSYADIASRIAMPLPHIDYTDMDNTFLMRWHKDIRQIDRQLTSLDLEIARRNKLIGVIG